MNDSTFFKPNAFRFLSITNIIYPNVIRVKRIPFSLSFMFLCIIRAQDNFFVDRPERAIKFKIDE